MELYFPSIKPALEDTIHRFLMPKIYSELSRHVHNEISKALCININIILFYWRLHNVTNLRYFYISGYSVIAYSWPEMSRVREQKLKILCNIWRFHGEWMAKSSRTISYDNVELQTYISEISCVSITTVEMVRGHAALLYIYICTSLSIRCLILFEYRIRLVTPWGFSAHRSW